MKIRTERFRRLGFTPRAYDNDIRTILADNPLTETRRMRTVTLSTMHLLKIVRENRETHIEEFVDAMKCYRDTAIGALELTTAGFKDGSEMDWSMLSSVMNDKPKEYTITYDRVIRMLELSVGEEVELDEREFAQYVMDEWEWMGRHKATVLNYSAS